MLFALIVFRSILLPLLLPRSSSSLLSNHDHPWSCYNDNRYYCHNHRHNHNHRQHLNQFGIVFNCTLRNILGRWKSTKNFLTWKEIKINQCILVAILFWSQCVKIVNNSTWRWYTLQVLIKLIVVEWELLGTSNHRACSSPFLALVTV